MKSEFTKIHLVFNSFNFFVCVCVGHTTTFGSWFSPSIMVDGLGIKLRINSGGHLSPPNHLPGPVFSSLGRAYRSELLDYGNLFLTFWGTTIQFSLPTTLHDNPSFSTKHFYLLVFSLLIVDNLRV